MHLKHLGFGQFLNEEEHISRAFRRFFPPVLVKMIFHLVFWSALALVVWFFYPHQLFYVWVGIILFGIFQVYRVFAKWYFNTVLMTSDSLMFVEWEKPFHVRAIRLGYWDMDEIEVEREGAGAYFGNYGHLIFNKIAGGSPYVFHKMPRPGRVCKILMEHKEKMLDAKNFTEESALKELLSQMVITHVRKNGQPARDVKPSIEEDSEEDSDFDSEEANEVPEPKAKIQSSKRKEKFERMNVEVEKVLDDEGGIEIDLEEK